MYWSVDDVGSIPTPAKDSSMAEHNMFLIEVRFLIRLRIVTGSMGSKSKHEDGYFNKETDPKKEK
jgi:hypothetical protein